MKIKIINKGQNPLPSYTHKGDACVDLRADFSNIDYKYIVLRPGATMVIPTGLYTEFDEGYLQILSRSGMCIKNSVFTIGGVIDSSYRQEIGVILHNAGNDHFTINQGDRIAQMQWRPVELMEFEEVTELSETDRGEGFGSSGVK